MAAYKRKIGGYKYNESIAAGRSATREQRIIIEQIIKSGPTREELYIYLVEIALLSSRIDDALDDLASYDPE